MPRLAFLTLVGVLTGIGAAWVLTDAYGLARTTSIVIGALCAVGLGAFAYVVARR